MSLDDSSKGAKECKRCYALLRNALQRKYLWNFCKKRARLAAMSEAPAFGFSTQYRLPEDFLRLIDVSGHSSWSIEGNVILTNASSPLDIIYSAKVTDTTKFDPLFTEAFSCLMAAELCEIFTQSNSKKETFMSLYQLALSEAKVTDAKEQHPVQLDESDWVLSRYGDSGGDHTVW